MQFDLDRALEQGPGTLTFTGPQTAEDFTREIRESFESVLRHSLTPPPNADAGFLSTSLPGRPWYRHMWTRDAGVFLRELVMFGAMEIAELVADYLMRMVRPNGRGYLCYPTCFVPGEPATGDELDGTAAIIIGLWLLWQRLPEESAMRASIYDFLHSPSSPLRYFIHVLQASPLIPGHGEFGGGMGAEGLHMNVVQNGLARLALIAGDRLESAAESAGDASGYRQAARTISAGIDRYLAASDGGWTWCVNAETLQPEPAVLESYWNASFAGINGHLCMQSDVLGLSTDAPGWDGVDRGRRTMERLASASVRRRLLDLYGMWPQFVNPPYDHLTSPSYGQGYAIQCALLLDDMELAGRMIDYLATATVNPPDGYRLDRESKYWLYEQYLSPEFTDIPGHDQGCGALNLVNVAEPMKIARIIAGIDDLQPGSVTIAPRLPGHWTGFHAERWPLLTENGVVPADIRLERTDSGEELTIAVRNGASIPRLSVALGAGHTREKLDLTDVRSVQVAYDRQMGYSHTLP